MLIRPYHPPAKGRDELTVGGGVGKADVTAFQTVFIAPGRTVHDIDP